MGANALERSEYDPEGKEETSTDATRIVESRQQLIGDMIRVMRTEQHLSKWKYV